MAKTAHRHYVKTRSGGGGLGRTLFWIVTRIGIPLAIVYGLLWWRVDAAIDDAFASAAGVVDARRQHTWVLPNGDISLEKFRLDPVPGRGLPAFSLTADRLVLHTPGLWWLVRSAVPGASRELPDRLGLSFEGFEATTAASMPDDGLIGGYSAMPFEAFGCDTNAWSRADLLAMGLRGEPTRLRLRAERESGSNFALRYELETANVGAAEGMLAFTTPAGEPSPAWLATATLREVRLGFRDQGFMAARNRHCAARAGIKESEFLTRHLDAIEDWFAADGRKPSPGLRDAYAGFVVRGGELTIEARPDRPLTMAGLGQVPENQLLDVLNPSLRVAGGMPLPLRFVPLRPDAAPVVAATLAAPPAAVPSNAAAAPAGAAPPANAPAGTATPANPPAAAIAAQPPATPTPGSYDALAAHIGTDVEVRTTLGTVRRGRLLAHAPNTLSLKLAGDDGGYTLTVPRDHVAGTRVLASNSDKP